MWRKLAVHFRSFPLPPPRQRSQSSALIPPALNLSPSPQNPNPSPIPSSKNPPPKTLTLESQSHLESSPQSSFSTHQTDEAWQPFKILASSHLPSPHLSNSLILHLSSLNDRLNLKRAFAAGVLPIERSSGSLSFETPKPLFQSFNSRDVPALTFALIRILLKNRIFLPLSMWGRELAQLSRRSGGGLAGFLKVFEENCRVCLDEKVDAMRLDLGSCNEVLDGCCRKLGSVSDAGCREGDGDYVEFGAVAGFEEFRITCLFVCLEEA